MPFKKTIFFPLYVEYVDEIFNPHPHPHIPHMRIIRIFRIRMANPNYHHEEPAGKKHLELHVPSTQHLHLKRKLSDLQV